MSFDRAKNFHKFFHDVKTRFENFLTLTSRKMKQKELQMVLLRSLVSVATATAGSLALVFLLKRFLFPKTNDADMKSALRKLQEIEVLPFYFIFKKYI